MATVTESLDQGQGNSVSVQVRIKLLERGETIAGWAKKYRKRGIKCSRTALSLAINHPPLYSHLLDRLRKDIGLS